MRKALVLVVLFVPSLVWAQWAPSSPNAVSRWEIGLSAGYNFGGKFDGLMPDDPNDVYQIKLEDSVAFGLELGIPVGGDCHVQLWASRQTTDMVASDEAPGGGGIVGEMDVTHFQVLWIQDYITPGGPTFYTGIGLGMTELRPDVVGSSSESGIAASVAVGTKFFFGRNMGLRLDARYIIAKTKNDSVQGTGDVMFTYPKYFKQTQVSLGFLYLW